MVAGSDVLGHDRCSARTAGRGERRTRANASRPSFSLVHPRAFGSPCARSGWSAFWRGLLGAIFVTAGVVAFFTPGDTFVGLAAVISFYFVFAGSWNLVSALTVRHVPGWWIQLVSGLVELGLGFWAAGSWRISATLLVALVGAMTLIRGVTQISLAFSLRSMRELAHQR